MARRTNRRASSATVELTEKQKQVVALATEGLTIEQAAKRMNIAASGVYNHVSKIRAKGVAIEFAKPEAHPSMDEILGAADTNGGGTSADDGITEAARKALGNDADQYVNALQQVIEECGARKAEIGETIGSLQNEDEALSLRMKKLGERKQEAVNVLDQIKALA